VSQGASAATWRYRARIVVHAPASVVADRLPIAAGSVEAIDENTCAFEAGSDTPETLALWLGMLEADFTVTDSPELVEHLRALSERYGRAAAAAS
jgi:hypothetical protein